MVEHRYERRKKQEAALRDHEAGMTIEEIARKYGRSITWVRMLGIKRARKENYKTQNMSFEILRELFNSKKSIKDIADEFGTHQKRIWKVYHLAMKAGIPRLKIRRAHDSL
jgi:transposase-like protein